MKNRIEIQEISKITKTAIAKHMLNEEHSALIVYSLNMIADRIQFIQKIFPQNTLHAIAVKANPLVKILDKVRKLNAGAEAASLPELYIAQKSGFDPENIVFDSPAKTHKELEYALKSGVLINADSFEELGRIDQLFDKCNSTSNVGLRINPQVGTGTIKSTSVAGKVSKFGVPLHEHKEEIITNYLNYKWLNGIHLHIGSQGISIEQLIEGLGKVYHLVLEINEQLAEQGRRLEFFDIGGGFPVSYHKDTPAKDIEAYCRLIQTNFPELYAGEFKLVTEFGRYIYANSAFAVSRVEYVKVEQDYKILSIHLGADFLLRKAYNPDDWHHEITILDKHGNVKTGIDAKPYIIAGPLCFAGDIIAREIKLPTVEEGDYLIIHDVGAYTLSMWSRYNSRQIPSILGYDEQYNFELLKQRETLDDLYAFWS